jgi:hypothetical protein
VFVAGFAISGVAPSFPTFGADKSPNGPELAPKEIGHLLKAYPLLTQNNPEAIGGVGVLLWGCDYLVGKATITITITTGVHDPMPCKRKVAFE